MSSNSRTGGRRKMARLVTCYKCKRQVNHTSTLICSTCKNNFEPSCIGEPKDSVEKALLSKWECTTCKKKKSNAQTALTIETSYVTTRKKQSSPISKTDVTPTSSQATPHCSTPTTPILELENIPTEHDVLHDTSLTLEQTLSRSVDYTIMEFNCIPEMQETITQLQSDLYGSQNELENIILENNDLRSQVSKLTKENNTLKNFLSNSPVKKNDLGSVQKRRRSLRNVDINTFVTPPKRVAETDIQLTEKINKQKQYVDSLEHQLEQAKCEIKKLNTQIEYLQRALQSIKGKESSFPQSGTDTSSMGQRTHNRGKMCILTNSNTCGTLRVVEDTFGREFDYCRYVLTNCDLEQLLKNIDSKLLNFDENDYCVIIIGQKDFKYMHDYARLVKKVRDSLEHITHTNILLCAPTYVCGAPIYNYKIDLFNNLLNLELQNNNYAHFIDTNRNLSFDMFSYNSGKLNKSGIKNMYKDILATIQNCRSFINSSHSAKKNGQQLQFFLE